MTTASPVAVLADDLIWGTRLARAVEADGGLVWPVRTMDGLRAALADGCRLVVVDLTARAYDGVTAIRLAADSAASVLAVAQHDDVALRKRALAAGARRVLAYRKLADDGPAAIAGWLAMPAAATRTAATR